MNNFPQKNQFFCGKQNYRAGAVKTRLGGKNGITFLPTSCYIADDSLFGKTENLLKKSDDAWYAALETD